MRKSAFAVVAMARCAASLRARFGKAPVSMNEFVSLSDSIVVRKIRHRVDDFQSALRLLAVASARFAKDFVRSDAFKALTLSLPPISGRLLIRSGYQVPARICNEQADKGRLYVDYIHAAGH
jgi:hypothetical protein